MKHCVLFILLLFPMLYVYGKKPQKGIHEVGIDSVTIDSTSVPVDSLALYKMDILNLESTISVLKERISNDSIKIRKLNTTISERDRSIIQLQKDLKDAKQQTKDSETLLKNLHKAFDSEDFYELILYFPLEVTYDSVDIANRLFFIETLRLKERHPVTTKKYFDMMANYHVYLKELAECVNKVIEEFRISGSIKPDREFTKDYYISGLKHTQYWIKRHNPYPESEIPYIERRLSRIDELFSNDSKFTQKAFQEIYKELTIRNDK